MHTDGNDGEAIPERGGDSRSMIHLNAQISSPDAHLQYAFRRFDRRIVRI